MWSGRTNLSQSKLSWKSLGGFTSSTLHKLKTDLIEFPLNLEISSKFLGAVPTANLLTRTQLKSFRINYFYNQSIIGLYLLIIKLFMEFIVWYLSSVISEFVSVFSSSL